MNLDQIAQYIILLIWPGAKEDIVVATMNGYIKSVPLNSYRAQRRGGKGKAGMGINEDDVTKDTFI